MSVDLLPAAVATFGGGALAGAIYLHERRRDDAMRATRVHFAVRFPLALEAKAARTALIGVAALPERSEVIIEVIAGSGVQHGVALPRDVEASAATSLTAAMPGLRLRRTGFASGEAALSLRLAVPTTTLLRTDDPEASSRHLLAGLTSIDDDERVVLRWAL